MKFDLNSSLKDKRVLYVVLFLAVTNLFGFLMARNFNAVVIFLLVGFIATYFSRNMIVILMIAIVVTNIVSGVKIIKEGMENNEDKEKKEKKDDDSEESSSDKKEEKMTTLSPASYDDEKKAKKKPKVDYAGTLEAAYDNLDNLLSSDALKNMTNDTQRLAEKQKLLMGNIKKLEPMMQKATAMLDGLDMPGMQGMIQSLSKNMMSMSGDSKDKKSSDE
jgi:uncharacterized membrane-anchored protein